MHVYNSPRSKNGFFIWISKSSKYHTYSFNSFFNAKIISSLCHFPYADTTFTENIRIIIFLERIEFFFCYTLWHKLIPRKVINYICKIIDCDRDFSAIQIFIQICTINQKWHSNRDSSKNAYRSISVFLCFKKFLSKSFFLWRELSFFFLSFCSFNFFKFFFCKSKTVYINIARLWHCFC